MWRMLIVDDEQDICDCLQCFFSARGFSVTATFSGEQALEWLASASVDVILLDLLLPGLSGLEVLKRIRARHPHTRIVIVTAWDQTELRHQAREYGAAAYITKPFDLNERTWSVVLEERL